MSEYAEGVVYLIFGVLLSPTIPAALYLGVRGYWLAWGVLGWLLIGVVAGMALASIVTIAKGYDVVFNS